MDEIRKINEINEILKERKIPLVIEKTTGVILEKLLKEIDHNCTPDLKHPKNSIL